MVCSPDNVSEERESPLVIRRRQVKGVYADAAATRGYQVIQLASRRFKRGLAPHLALAEFAMASSAIDVRVSEADNATLPRDEASASA